jgi:hypothetical protein
MGHRAVGDPAVNVAGGLQVVAVGASPFTYTNQSQNTELLYVSQPAAVTGTFAKNGVALAALTTPAATAMTVPILLNPGQSFTYTYNAGAPTMSRDVL